MSVERLKQALLDPDAETRRRGVLHAATEVDEAVGPLILEALGDDDWRVRKEAVQVVTKRAVELSLIEALVQSICQGENVGLRNAALDVLEALGPNAAPALIAALPNVPEHARKFVVEALGESGGHQVVRELAKAAASEDPNVAGEAIEALARIGGPEAERIMRSRLGASDPFLRMAALDALNRLHAVIPWEELEPLLTDRLLRRVAISALGRTGRIEALEPLFSALEESTVHVVGAAAIAIARLSGGSPQIAKAAAPRLALLDDRARAWLRAVLTSSGDAEARRSAAELLAWARDSESLSALVAHLTSEAPSPQTLAALRAWGRDAVAPMLALLPTLASVQERAVALELTADLALVAEGIEPAVRERVRSTLRRSLSDREHPIVAAAARCLAHWADDADAALLVGHALSADPAVARACATALEALVRRAPDAVEKALSGATLSGPQSGALAPVVAALGGPRALDRLQGLLSGDDADVRRAALHGLGRVGGRRAAELVALALADEDPTVQVVATQVLGHIRDEAGDAPGAAELILALGSELPQIRQAAARALGYTGSTRAVEPLQELLRSEDTGAAMAAVEALGALSPGELAGILEDALHHADREVVKAALKALSDSHDPAAPEKLIAALSHAAWDVRQMSAELIGDLGVVSAVAALKSQLEHESDDLARVAFIQALRALGEEA
jgi:HEAT repeat protein